MTLDRVRNMQTLVKTYFPDADLVTDRFHVVKLAIDALQHIRVKLRWKELAKENHAIQEAKKQGIKYIPIVLRNGDTPNYWHGVGISLPRNNPIGLKIKYSEQLYCLNNTLLMPNLSTLK